MVQQGVRPLHGAVLQTDPVDGEYSVSGEELAARVCPADTLHVQRGLEHRQTDGEVVEVALESRHVEDLPLRAGRDRIVTICFAGDTLDSHPDRGPARRLLSLRRTRNFFIGYSGISYDFSSFRKVFKLSLTFSFVAD